MKKSYFKKSSFLFFLFISTGVSLSFAEKIVVLTIDDGPHRAYTKRIIHVLEEKEVPATFFLVGKMIKRHPDLVRKIYDSGFEIGNHTYNDVRMTSMSEEEIVRSLEPVNDLLENITGKRTSFFRPPGGRLNSLVLRKVGALGYHTVLWTRNTMDTAPEIKAEEIYYHATRNPDRREIILFHSGVEATIEALGDIIEYYKEKGYKFRTVSDISVPFLSGGRSILKDSQPLWPYVLRKRDEFKYPPLRRQRVPEGGIIFVASAAGAVLLFKLSSPAGRKKSISLVFIGAQKKELREIVDTLDEKGVKASFFLPPGKKNEAPEFLGGHSVALLGEKGPVRPQIKMWVETFGQGTCNILPFYYCEGGYSEEEIKNITEEDFVPVDFRTSPLSKKSAVGQDLYEYIQGSLGPGKTIPLRADCPYISEILSDIIEKIRDGGYNCIPLEKYIASKYAS